MAAKQEAVPSNALTMEQDWKLPDRGTVAIIFLILTETSLFTIFVVAYLVYIGKSLTGPYPKDVLEVPIVASICLLSSSLTVVFAEHALKHNNLGRFKLWWTLTIALGLEFLISTGLEWKKLITQDHLTIRTNLFGSTFYSLVGLHASHVIVGLTFLTLVLLATLRGFPIQTQLRRVLFLSWYWHFVDAVWVVVFTVVYIIGR
ncbi:MAG TPA: heme-copper oxidase subunit III [Bryobacteraceae bacterium]|jgi:cytochrome c oxidase subunit 3/cytochrome o ubiquinol oxidase subunit 3|nr:heme-copper oxidase subunit III [Bryobacteraceae bacterium]